MTASSLTFKLIKRNFIHYRSIQNTSNNHNIHEYCKAAYFGGISTVLKPKSDGYNLNVIDINSSYPHAMTKDLPVGHGI
jgi:hypothetical protein